jgi:hypothetical protein
MTSVRTKRAFLWYFLKEGLRTSSLCATCRTVDHSCCSIVHTVFSACMEHFMSAGLHNTGLMMTRLYNTEGLTMTSMHSTERLMMTRLHSTEGLMMTNFQSIKYLMMTSL